MPICTCTVCFCVWANSSQPNHCPLFYRNCRGVCRSIGGMDPSCHDISRPGDVSSALTQEQLLSLFLLVHFSCPLFISLPLPPSFTSHQALSVYPPLSTLLTVLCTLLWGWDPGLLHLQGGFPLQPLHKELKSMQSYIVVIKLQTEQTNSVKEN